MRLPNFIVLGPPRTGTTWLYTCLAEHPEVFVSDRKELRYFDQHFAQGSDRYARAFARAPSDIRAVGDITPGYFQHPGVPERIHDLLAEDVDLFIVHRDPVERAYSAYKGALRRGETEEDFPRALESIPRFVANSQYARQLNRFAAVFPLDRLHLIDFESIASHPLAHLRAYYKILGLTDFSPQALDKKVNTQLASGRSTHLTTMTRMARQAIETTALGRKLMWQIRQKGLTRKLHDLNADEKQVQDISTTMRAELFDRWFAADQQALEAYAPIRITGTEDAD